MFFKRQQETCFPLVPKSLEGREGGGGREGEGKGEERGEGRGRGEGREEGKGRGKGGEVMAIVRSFHTALS